MKKSLPFFGLISVALFFLQTTLLAQIPQLFNYQGIARDAGGNVLPARKIGVQLSVLDGGPAGSAVYQETFTDTTNAFGLFTMPVGGGTVVSGSFASIDWATGNKYLQTAIDLTGGTNYALSGTTQLLSVPYALYAQSAAVSTGGSWSTNGNNFGINDPQPFLGTTDGWPLLFLINNQPAGVLDPGTLNTLLGQGSSYPNSITGTPAGQGNAGLGFSVLGNNYGNLNTAVGAYALYNNTSGTQNVAIGGCASSTGFTQLPGTLTTNQTGSFITAIGTGADVSTDGLANATAIGYMTVVNASNKVRIGNANVTVIEGQVPFTTPSDGRFKFNVREDVKGLDFILKLRPVTYQFNTKKEEDFMRGVRGGAAGAGAGDPPEAMPVANCEAMMLRRTGFIAQEVEKAARTAGYDFDGLKVPKTDSEYYSLSYASFVVPLVKAVQEQEETIEELRKEVRELRQLIEQNKMGKP
jgi:hypothetical protein